MKKPQFISLILSLLIMVFTLTSFGVVHFDSSVNPDNDIAYIDVQNKYGLIGTWVKDDDPETSITFNSDFTVVVKSKGTSTTSKWSVIEMDREVCIGDEKCKYFEASEAKLVFKENKVRIQYSKVLL
ncbi:hypothetical protein [Aquimarina pacifica]|uniref:hypothetical protein n=1 Tax=Aquimarina pacifica TaxID=1296415 RepID=UPI00046F6D44|nr:hypothetical protein [Aquimarina pacifica]